MDDEVFELIKAEERRQAETLQMIASENYMSPAVRAALASGLGNKYSEGYPGKRYYQGNKYIDEIETLAIERAKKLFGCHFVNVQPYSGSPANAEIFMALLEPGDKVMGMKLSGGGHLTHGHPKVTFSGKFFESMQYDVNEEGWIDYSDLEELAKREKPKLIVVGTTAYPRKLDFEKVAGIGRLVGAKVLADISHVAGLVAGGVYDSPVGVADVVMTTTHKTLRGPRGAMIMTNDEETARKIDRAVFPGFQGGPHNATTAAIAVALKEAATVEFKKYARAIVENAAELATELIKSGWDLTTGGTDTHLLVADLRKLGIGGKAAAELLESAGIVVNYNTVPHDTNPPANPSGLRMGTPALTTRGMGRAEMKLIARWIAEVMNDTKTQKLNSSKLIQEVKNEITKLCEKFPTP